MGSSSSSLGKFKGPLPTPTLHCTNNHLLVSRQVPRGQGRRCDLCRIGLPYAACEQWCQMCNYDLCLNCIAQQDGQDPNFAIMTHDVAMLLADTASIPYKKAALERLVTYTMSDCSSALFRTKDLLNAVCLQGSKRQQGKKQAIQVVQFAITLLSNLADNESLVRLLLADPHFINVVVDAVQSGEDSETRCNGLAAFTNILYMPDLRQQLFEQHPRIMEIALHVAGVEDSKTYADGRYAALLVLRDFAQCEAIKPELVTMPAVLETAVNVIMTKELLTGGKNWPKGSKEGYTTKCKEAAIAIVLLLYKDRLKEVLAPWPDLPVRLREIRHSDNSSPNLQFDAQTMLHGLGLASKPALMQIQYLTRIYYRDGGVGIGFASEISMAPDNLLEAPRTPVQYEIDAPPAKVVKERDGSRAELRIAKVILMYGEGEELVI